MTTQTTTIQPSSTSPRAIIAAAACLGLLGGALLWHGRPARETAAPVATASISTTSEGVAPLGGGWPSSTGSSTRPPQPPPRQW